MKMTESFGKINEKDIIDLEYKLSLNLPKDYRDFLLSTNGGKPSPNIFKTLNGEYETDIHYFYGINSEIYDLYKNCINIIDRIPVNFFPIANDSLGNFILIDCKGEGVYLFDHEIELKIFIANSFTSFVNNLYSHEQTYSEFDKAIFTQNLHYFKSRIQSGEHIDCIKNDLEQKASIVATLLNKQKLLKYFISQNASIEGLLFAACKNGHFQIVQYLLGKGADPNERSITINNNTALIQASHAGHLDIVKVLIEKNADIWATDEYGQNALDKSYWSNNQELINYFEKEIYCID